MHYSIKSPQQERLYDEADKRTKPDASPKSPTTSGEMREDKYWVLKSSTSFWDRVEKMPVEPIGLEQVSLDAYQKSVHLQTRLQPLGYRLHGRRINNEVELFPWDDGKETPGLRESLEAKGLTVRTWTPEATTRKFPTVTYNEVLGKGARSDMERCLDAVGRAIERVEQDEETPIDYAVLADAGGAGKKVMLMCKFRVKDFYDLYADAAPLTITISEHECKILGTVDSGEPRFREELDEEEILAFFRSKKGELTKQVNVTFVDYAQQREEEEEREKKAMKKQAKKLRRRLTALTNLDEQSQAAVPVEDDECVKARQREKAKAKKKAQKERKKEEAGLAMAFRVESIEGNEVVFRSVQGESMPSKTNNKSSASKGQSDKKSRGNGSMSSQGTGSVDRQAVGEVKIVHVETAEDIQRVLKGVQGNIYVAAPDEDEPERTDGPPILNSVHYLGRGRGL